MTYDELAARLGVTLCPGGCRWEAEGYPHHSGSVSVLDHTVHWTPRRMTKRGLRNFLKVAALLVDERILFLPDRGERIYRQNCFAYHYARGMGIVFPRSFSYTDRARAAATYRGSNRTIRRWIRNRGL